MSETQNTARVEAVRLYNTNELESDALAAFVQGAEWQASRPVTDAQAEAAGRALYGAEEWDPLSDRDRKYNYRGLRAAIEAAQKVSG